MAAAEIIGASESLTPAYAMSMTLMETSAGVDSCISLKSRKVYGCDIPARRKGLKSNEILIFHGDMTL